MTYRKNIHKAHKRDVLIVEFLSSYKPKLQTVVTLRYM